MSKKNFLNPTEVLCIQAMAAYLDTGRAAQAVRLNTSTVSFFLQNALKKTSTQSLGALFQHPSLQPFLERNPFLDK